MLDPRIRAAEESDLWIKSNVLPLLEEPDDLPLWLYSLLQPDDEEDEDGDDEGWDLLNNVRELSRWTPKTTPEDLLEDAQENIIWISISSCYISICYDLDT